MATTGPSIPTDLPDSSWMRRAACKDAPGAMTPNEDEGEESARLRDNRDHLCRGDGDRACLVLNACLAWAIDARIRTGIAGGLTWPEREHLDRPGRRAG
jgi:hypothetical protein